MDKINIYKLVSMVSDIKHGVDMLESQLNYINRQIAQMHEFAFDLQDDEINQFFKIN